MSNKYSDRVKAKARKLFFAGLSLDKIVLDLKASFKKACAGLHRATVHNWVKAGNWESEKQDLIKKGIAKNKKTDLKEKSVEEIISELHSESYQLDSELRMLAHSKIKAYLKENEVSFVNIRIFIDIYRVSTGAMIKLLEIARGKEEVEPLLDELLKMREVKPLEYVPPERKKD